VKTIGFYNAINPVGSGLNIADDIEVKQFFDERGPASGRQQLVQILSRRDCSDRDDVEDLMQIVNNPDLSRRERREAVDKILLSYRAEIAVDTLVRRGVDPSKGHVILLDHETTAWMSGLHFSVYFALTRGIMEAYPKSLALEFGGMPSNRIGPEPHEDMMFAARRGSLHRNVICAAPHIYVPESWLKLSIVQLNARIDHCIKGMPSEWGDYRMLFVLNPYVEHTEKVKGDYSSGIPVPAPIMEAIIRRVLAARGEIALWSAHADLPQALRIRDTIKTNFIEVIEKLERE